MGPLCLELIMMAASWDAGEGASAFEGCPQTLASVHRPRGHQGLVSHRRVSSNPTAHGGGLTAAPGDLAGGPPKPTSSGLLTLFGLKKKKGLKHLLCTGLDTVGIETSVTSSPGLGLSLCVLVFFSPIIRHKAPHTASLQC